VFSIIKDRVKEIKEDQDWKEKIAEQWNDAAKEDEGRAAVAKAETASVFSYSKLHDFIFSYRIKTFNHIFNFRITCIQICDVSQIRRINERKN
jgi:hypothetical protein